MANGATPSSDEVAAAPGRVTLRVCTPQGIFAQERATFHFKAGATLQFLRAALDQHAKRLVVSSQARQLEHCDYTVNLVVSIDTPSVCASYLFPVFIDFLTFLL